MERLCTATSARTEARRYVALDSLRGLAAIAVMLFHIGDFGLLGGLRVFQHGWLLVDFFFVLSGFVIAASYGERLAHGYSRTRFMALRLGRVLPLHLAMVAAFATVEFALFRPWLHEAHDPVSLWRGLFLLDGLRTQTGNFFAPVSWSISVEIMLYIAAAALFGAGRIGRAIALLMGIVAALAIVTQWNYPGFGFLLQRGVLGFGIGVVAHALHGRVRLSAPTVAEIAVLLAAITLIVTTPWPGWTIVLGDGLFGVVVVVFAADRGAVSRLLQTRPMVGLGTLSYSLYMTHLLPVILLNRGLPRLFAWVGRPDLVAQNPNTFGLMSVELGPVAETALVAALIAGVIGLSLLTHRRIEEPARRWSRRRVAALRADTFHDGAGALSPAA